MRNQPALPELGQAIPLITTAGFVRQSHFDQARFQGWQQKGLSEMRCVLQTECFLQHIARVLPLRGSSQQAHNFSGDLVGNLVGDLVGRVPIRSLGQWMNR